MYVCNWTEDLKGIINYLALARQNNFFPRILIIRGMTFEFKYLGDFEFIFENNLGSLSGDQELAFDEKKRMSKISCKCTFKLSESYKPKRIELKNTSSFQEIDMIIKHFQMEAFLKQIVHRKLINTK
jgi:hypothetical protein